MSYRDKRVKEDWGIIQHLVDEYGEDTVVSCYDGDPSSKAFGNVAAETHRGDFPWLKRLKSKRPAR